MAKNNKTATAEAKVERTDAVADDRWSRSSVTTHYEKSMDKRSARLGKIK
jgi:hypothetical protein